MENEKRILCVGEASVEFAAVEKELPLAKVHSFTKNVAGEASLAMKIAQRGENVAFLGKVGEDGFGVTICEQLANAQVDFSCVSKDCGYETAASFCAYHRDGSLLERQYVNDGADRYLQEKDVGWRVLEKVRLLHFSSYGLMSESGKCLGSLLTLCLKKAIEVSFSIREDCPLQKGHVREAVYPYLGFANLLFLNHSQIAYLTGLMCSSFAVKALFRDHPRLQEVVLREGEELVLYTRRGEIARDRVGYSQESDFMSLYLIHSRLGEESIPARKKHFLLSCTFAKEVL